MKKGIATVVMNGNDIFLEFEGLGYEFPTKELLSELLHIIDQKIRRTESIETMDGRNISARKSETIDKLRKYRKAIKRYFK